MCMPSVSLYMPQGRTSRNTCVYITGTDGHKVKPEPVARFNSGTPNKISQRAISIHIHVCIHTNTHTHKYTHTHTHTHTYVYEELQQ